MGKRLIDANELMEYARNQKSRSVDCNDIARFPTVDAVEVVRCKDCKHYHLSRLECHNEHMNGIIGIYGFCSYGERRSDE